MRVWPKNDVTRKMLKHGVIAFPGEGPADWPDDTFTHRRIMDGDVTTEEPKKVAEFSRTSEVIPKAKPDVGKA